MIPAWPEAPTQPRADGAEVHVWRLRTGGFAACEEVLLNLLAPEERERAARFAFPEGRQCFVVCRGMLRAVLGRYLGRAPEALRFRYGGAGKPFLAGEDAESGLSFNLSHSGSLGLVAVTQGRAVGVDVERLRPNLDGLGIAHRFFLPEEVEALLRLPPERQEEGFLTAWTRKEALLKGVGEGLRLSLKHFHVSVDPDAPAEVIAQRGSDGSEWRLVDLEVGPGYRAAVTAAGDGWQVVPREAGPDWLRG